MAGAVAWSYRRCLHGPAGRGAPGLDAGEPALFRLPQRRWFGRAVFRLHRQYRAEGRWRRLDRRQRTRAARPLRRCAPLLGPRPQGAAGIARAAAGSHHLPCQAWFAGREGPAAGAPGGGDRPAGRRRPGAWHATPRGSPRRTWSPAWSANSPSCKASWGAITRCTTARTGWWRTRSATTTRRKGRPTRCLPRTCRSRWRWRTSWICWWVSSPSASGRPAPAIHMRCAAPRWASSASSARTTCGSPCCR